MRRVEVNRACASIMVIGALEVLVGGLLWWLWFYPEMRGLAVPGELGAVEWMFDPMSALAGIVACCLAALLFFYGFSVWLNGPLFEVREEPEDGGSGFRRMLEA